MRKSDEVHIDVSMVVSILVACRFHLVLRNGLDVVWCSHEVGHGRFSPPGTYSTTAGTTVVFFLIFFNFFHQSIK